MREQRVGWDVIYAELTKYEKEHGNANVTERYEQNLGLGTWVNNQRKCSIKTSLVRNKSTVFSN